MAAFFSFALRAENQAKDTAQATLRAVEAGRFSFKVSQLTHRAVRLYDQAVIEQDEAKRARAERMLRAALGFSYTPLAQSKDRIDELTDHLDDLVAVMAVGGLAPTAAQRVELEARVNDIERATMLYEQAGQARFQQQLTVMSTTEYRNAVFTRVAALSLVTGILLCAVILVFMRSEQKQTNRRIEAESASEAKSAFLANMSHEIRTPMNGIVGMVELLSQAQMPDDQAQMVDSIHDSSIFLLQIIDDILDAAKIDAGQMELENESFNLLHAVERTAETLAITARDAHVLFQVYFEPDVPDCIKGDALRLRQILLNLLSNGIKFSKGTEDAPGRVQLWISANAPAGELKFRVVDTGIGMTSDVIERIFLPFKQAEESTTRKYGGTGLGLVITRNLVDLMHGRLQVMSTPGEGSEFSVTIPLQVCNQTENLADLTDVALLLHLDNRYFAQRTAAAFERRGATVHITPQLEEVLFQIEKNTKDTVVLLGLDQQADNDAVLAILRNRFENVNVLVLDPTRGKPKGLLEPRLYVSCRYPMHHSDVLRGIAKLMGRPTPANFPVGEKDKELLQKAVSAKLRAAPIVDPKPVQTLLAAPHAKVLIIEDNPLNIQVLTRQLQKLGYDYGTATNGAEGLEAWRKGGFDAVLTDCQMPVMDGLDMTRQIRSEEQAAGLAPMPVLAISASALPQEAEKSLQAGVSEYLTKPLKIDVLNAALGRWLTPDGAPKDGPSGGQDGGQDPAADGVEDTV
ncbi:ATP-binding protein [Thalassobius sp. Cn5-15]|uniref:ATP-binding protein n=1 Tax=Thalassobius sp. Cn5-15 TaxID=2917763 RepID=UPI001EF25AE4|nr:ATP-binding protein [Thalassobius sp. Cn5-15]